MLASGSKSEVVILRRRSLQEEFILEMGILRCLFVIQVKISGREVHKFGAPGVSPGLRYKWWELLD